MGNLTTTKSGELVSFASPNVAAIKSLKVHFSPKQTGNGEPSPTNIRPFVPWTEFEVTHCGKNLCDRPFGGGDYMDLPIPSGMTATASSKIGGIFTLANNFDDNFQRYTQVKDDDLQRYKITFTVQENENTYRFNRQSGGQNCQLEIGSVATPYEPYRGQTIQIEFDKTIYGGWVDLVTGEVVRDWLINTHTVAATDGTPGGAGTGNDTNYRFIAWNLASAHLPDNERTGQAVCNIAPNSRQVGGTRFWLGGGTVYMILPNDNKEYSVIIAYAERDLNTDTYQLEPSELQTLIGTNNIWSNADYVEVEYEIAEPKSILDIKKRIIASSPHLETVETIYPNFGTVTFNTDMAAPLRECSIQLEMSQNFGGSNYATHRYAWAPGGGKNLFNINSDKHFYIDNMDNVVYSDNAITTEIVAIPNEEYYFSVSPINFTYSYVYYMAALDANNNILYRQRISPSTSPSVPPIHFITPENTAKIWAGVEMASNFHNIQLELGDHATYYEPYENICEIVGSDGIVINHNGTDIPISWQSEVGTVYLCTVDPVNGTISETYQKLNLADLNYTQISIGPKVTTISAFPGTIVSRNAMLCNIFRVVSNPNVAGIEGIDWNAGRLNICVTNNRGINSIADFIAWLGTLNTTPIIVAKLATPVIHTFTKHPIITSHGVNTFSVGEYYYMELSYWKH